MRMRENWPYHYDIIIWESHNGTLLPIISRLITFEDKIARDKGFDRIFYCAFGAVSSGIEETSYNLFLLKRGLNINCISKLNINWISQIISTLHPTIDSLQKVLNKIAKMSDILWSRFLLVSHRRNKNFTKISPKVKLKWYFLESTGYILRGVFE